MIHSPKSLDENTVFLLGMASKLIYDSVVEIFRSGRFGITVEQFSILGILWYREGIRQQDIAEAVRRDKTTVARVINTMIRHGLLYRRADEGDKRTKLVFLTQRGKDLQEATVNASGQVYLRALEGLKEKEIRQLNKFLHKIIRNTENAL